MYRLDAIIGKERRQTFIVLLIVTQFPLIACGMQTVYSLFDKLLFEVAMENRLLLYRKSNGRYMIHSIHIWIHIRSVRYNDDP